MNQPSRAQRSTVTADSVRQSRRWPGPAPRRMIAQHLADRGRWIGVLALVLAPVLVLASGLLVGSPARAEGGGSASATVCRDTKRLNLGNAVVIGASVSDGFGLAMTIEPPGTGPDAPGDGQRGPVRRSFKLADVLAAITGADTPRPRSEASSMFFMAAERTGARQVRDALAAGASPVIAVDYLFWYAYGVMPEEDRADLFEKGLANLARLEAPVVVGDIPDMSDAIGRMLSRAQVPSGQTLARLNQRLRAWAAERKNIVVMPLAEVVARGKDGGRITLGGNTYEGESARGLLQDDRLHASTTGMVAIAQEALLRLGEAGLIDRNARWERDPARVIATLRERLSQPAPAATPPAPAPSPAPAPAPAPSPAP